MSNKIVNPNNILLEEDINLGPNVQRVNTEGSLNSLKSKNTTKKASFFRAPAALRRATASFFRAPSPLSSSNDEVQESPLFQAFQRRNLPLVKKLAANLGYQNKITLAVRNAAENAHNLLVTDMMANSYLGKSTKQIQNEESALHNIVTALGGTTESSGGKRKTRRRHKSRRKSR